MGERGRKIVEIPNEWPKNREHFRKLLEFCKEVVTICQDLDIVPILNGSLAVFGYTQSQAISVNDVDLACSELEFPRLSRALAAKGIDHEVKAWHVLQARRDNLKIEFDSMEFWMIGVSEDYTTMNIGGCVFKVVGHSDLRELYRRGLEATANQVDASQQVTHALLVQKYELLASA